MKKLLKRIANVFTGNGNGKRLDLDEPVDPDKINHKNVDRETSRLKLQIIKARAELECAAQKLDGEAPGCSE